MSTKLNPLNSKDLDKRLLWCLKNDSSLCFLFCHSSLFKKRHNLRSHNVLQEMLSGDHIFALFSWREAFQIVIIKTVGCKAPEEFCLQHEASLCLPSGHSLTSCPESALNGWCDLVWRGLWCRGFPWHKKIHEKNQESNASTEVK